MVRSPDKRAGPLNEGLQGVPGDDDKELKEDAKEDADDESWMFKTFSKVAMGGKGKQGADKRANDARPAARQSDYSDPFLAVGLNDLLQFDAAPTYQYPPPSSGAEASYYQSPENWEMPDFNNFDQQNLGPQAFADNNFREPPP